MKTFDVKPLVGVEPIQFGMTRYEARAALNAPFEYFEKSRGDMVDAYFDASLQIFCDQEDRVVYIELSRNANLKVLYNNVLVFDTPATELVALISQQTPFDPNEPELGYSYTFPALELSLWRPVVYEDGTDADGKFFSTIGIGTLGYFSVNAAEK